jgi:CRISPR-associated protein Cas2
MYVIMVYDVNVKRVNKVLKIGRKYLNWTLRSVLEGFLTEELYENLKGEIMRVINTEEDAVYFYLLDTYNVPHKTIIGATPGKFNFIE